MIHHRLCPTCGYSADATHSCELVIASRENYIADKLNTRANAGDWDQVKWVIAALKYMAQNGGVELDAHDLSIDCSKLADKLTAALPENQKS